MDSEYTPDNDRRQALQASGILHSRRRRTDHLFAASLTLVLLLVTGCTQEEVEWEGAAGADSDVAGTVTFRPTEDAGAMLVDVDISGLEPGEHGFHIKEVLAQTRDQDLDESRDPDPGE